MSRVNAGVGENTSRWFQQTGVVRKSPPLSILEEIDQLLATIEMIDQGFRDLILVLPGIQTLVIEGYLLTLRAKHVTKRSTKTNLRRIRCDMNCGEGFKVQFRNDGDYSILVGEDRKIWVSDVRLLPGHRGLPKILLARQK
jgi:hypothetical protein